MNWRIGKLRFRFTAPSLHLSIISDAEMERIAVWQEWVDADASRCPGVFFIDSGNETAVVERGRVLSVH